MFQLTSEYVKQIKPSLENKKNEENVVLLGELYLLSEDKYKSHKSDVFSRPGKQLIPLVVNQSVIRPN